MMMEFLVLDSTLLFDQKKIKNSSNKMPKSEVLTSDREVTMKSSGFLERELFGEHCQLSDGEGNVANSGEAPDWHSTSEKSH